MLNIIIMSEAKQIGARLTGQYKETFLAILEKLQETKPEASYREVIEHLIDGAAIQLSPDVAAMQKQIEDLTEKLNSYNAGGVITLSEEDKIKVDSIRERLETAYGSEVSLLDLVKIYCVYVDENLKKGSPLDKGSLQYARNAFEKL